MTSTTSAEPRHGRAISARKSLRRRFGAALRRLHVSDRRLVQIHVGARRDAHARRLDDVDGLDADARPVVAGCRRLVSRHVGRHDGGHDVAVAGSVAVALPRGAPYGGRGARRSERGAPRSTDGIRGRGIPFRVDLVRRVRFSPGYRAGRSGDAAAGGGARRSDRERRCRPDRRHAPAHRVEGASARLLPRAAERWITSRCRRRLAVRPAHGPALGSF